MISIFRYLVIIWFVISILGGDVIGVLVSGAILYTVH